MTDDQLAAEQRARLQIDRQLTDAGRCVQSRADLDLFASSGIAVRKVIMKAGHGRVDHMPYVDKRVVGVIEAKPEGTPLSGVEWQSAMYAEGSSPDVRVKVLTNDGPLPFVLEAPGLETHLTNGPDPDSRARRIFAVPRPETLARAIRDAHPEPDAPTWLGEVSQVPPLATERLRPARIKAVEGIERSFAEQRYSRSLAQMAASAGKIYTAVTQYFRLLGHVSFRRVLSTAKPSVTARCTSGRG